MAARNRNEHISVSYYSIFMILVPNYGELRTLGPCLRCMIRFKVNFTFSRSSSRSFKKKTLKVQYFYYKCVKFEFRHLALDLHFMTFTIIKLSQIIL